MTGAARSSPVSARAASLRGGAGRGGGGARDYAHGRDLVPGGAGPGEATPQGCSGQAGRGHELPVLQSRSLHHLLRPSAHRFPTSVPAFRVLLPSTLAPCLPPAQAPRPLTPRPTPTPARSPHASHSITVFFRNVISLTCVRPGQRGQPRPGLCPSPGPATLAPRTRSPTVRASLPAPPHPPHAPLQAPAPAPHARTCCLSSSRTSRSAALVSCSSRSICGPRSPPVGQGAAAASVRVPQHSLTRPNAQP